MWGSTFVIVQNAIQVLPPNLFNGVRFFIAAILLTLWAYRKRTFSIHKSTWIHGLFLGMFLFFGYALQTLGLLYTSSSKAGFITGLSVLIVPILSVFLLKTKMTIFSMIGVLIGLTGLFLLTAGDFSSFTIGDILVLLCAFAFAFHIIFTDKYSRKHRALPLTIIQLVTVSLFSFFAFGLFEVNKYTVSLAMFTHFDVVLALIITSLFATAYAFIIQTTFQPYTTATRVALIFAMEPVFAALTAFILIGERLTWMSTMGCVLIFIAMIVSELRDVPKINPQSSKNHSV
nr:DMT family transporter [Bacillus sp. FJAT-47783]